MDTAEREAGSVGPLGNCQVAVQWFWEMWKIIFEWGGYTYADCVENF